MNSLSTSLRPASASHDLLLVERAESLSLKLRDALQRKGFVIKAAATSEDAEGLASDLVRPILLFECGSRTGSKEFVSHFTSSSVLKNFPAIVLGKDVDGLADELYGLFSSISTLRTPCTPHELLETINYLSERYLTLDEKRERSVSHETEQTSSTEDVKQQAIVTPHTNDDEAPPISHELYSKFDSVATLYFDQARESELLSKDLGGGTFSKLGVSGEGLVPAWRCGSSEFDSLMSQISEIAGKWGKQHILRVGFVADNILSELSLPENVLRNARIAARLLNIQLVRRSKNFLRKEFLGRGSLLVRKELCSLMKDSALELATTHRQPDVAEIVVTVARLIGREEPLSDHPNVVASSGILVAEILDRACFQTGHWNPRAAHLLLRRIAAGKLRDLHPAALCGLAKILTEALSEGPPAHLLPKTVRENFNLLDRARENREQVVAINEAKVRLDELVPGMKLSQPLFAFDGRQLLEENLTLDQDLIWRIWQLSALRPINAPIIILRKIETETEIHEVVEPSADDTAQRDDESLNELPN